MVCRDFAFESTLGIYVGIKMSKTRRIGRSLFAVHNLTDYEISVTEAVTAGSTTATIDITAQTIGAAATPVAVPETEVLIEAGTILKFGQGTALSPFSYLITGDEYVIEPGTPQEIVLDEPVLANIPDNAKCTSKLPLYLPCRVANVTPQRKVADVTNFGSGVGTEGFITGSGKQFNLEMDLAVGSRGQDVIRSMVYDDEFLSFEAWLEVIYRSGESHQGYALIRTVSPTNTVQDKRPMTLEASYQGSCYSYGKPDPAIAA